MHSRIKELIVDSIIHVAVNVIVEPPRGDGRKDAIIAAGTWGLLCHIASYILAPRLIPRMGVVHRSSCGISIIETKSGSLPKRQVDMTRNKSVI